MWSEDKEKKLNFIEQNIKTMTEKRRKASISSQLDDIDELIKSYEDQYSQIYKDRMSLLALSAESLSITPVLEFTISISFFEDVSLSKQMFSLEDVIEFSTQQLNEVIVCYKSFADKFSNQNLRRVSVDKNVRHFIKASAGAEAFFGLTGCRLTSNQIKLFDLSKYFSSLIDQIKEITEEEKSNPDEIESLYILQMNENQIKPAETRGKLLEVFSKT